MIISLPIVIGLIASVSARCGTRKPSKDVKALHTIYRAKEANSAKRPTVRQAEAYVVDTYVHIIVSGNTTEDGYVEESQIYDQINVLNNAYASTGFSFNLVKTLDILNATWRSIEAGSQIEYEMKSRLRQGRYQDLNIYIDTIAPIQPDGGQVLGYATFPNNASPREFELDGVVIDSATLPGGVAPYDGGITTVHEVGHWLSLFHTFEAHDNEAEDGGCYGDGDFIFDTPSEANAAFGCMENRDTCTGSTESDNTTSEPGTDPIHNYMDYSDDSCLNVFTDGQIIRMRNSYTDTRVNYVPGDGGEVIDQPPTGGPPHGG